MATDRKVRISVVIRQTNTKQSHVHCDSDAYNVLDEIKKLIGKMSPNDDEVDTDSVIHLLKASKLSNEIMADAFIDVERSDLFESKIESIAALDELINQINK
jgi:hypothetical protein